MYDKKQLLVIGFLSLFLVTAIAIPFPIFSDRENTSSQIPPSFDNYGTDQQRHEFQEWSPYLEDYNSTAIREQYYLATEGASSSQDVTFFSETSPDDISLDPDSDTNRDFEKSEWGFGESGAEDDIALDPDSDTDRDVQYQEWDFDETLDPDITHYPDSVMPNGYTTYSAFDYDGDSTSGSVSYVNAKDSNVLYINDVTNPCSPAGYFNYSIASFSATTDLNIDTIHVVGYLETSCDAYARVYAYNYTLGDWDYLFDVTGYWTWADYDFDLANECYWQNDLVMLKYNGSDTVGYSAHLGLDLFVIQVYSWYGDYFNDMSDVSGWSSYVQGLDAGDYGVGTDGDVGEFYQVNNDTGYEAAIWTVSFDSPITITTGKFLEIRLKIEDTSSTGQVFQGRMHYSDGAGGDLYYTTWYAPSSDTWVTKRWCFDDLSYSGVGFLDKTFTSFSIVTVAYTASVDSGNFSTYIDYIRIGSVNGWSHDCSVTDGFEDNVANWDITFSSDSDIVTIDATPTATNWYGIADIVYDTTTTACDIETDYYPFIEMSYKITDVNTGAIWKLAPNVDGLEPSSDFTLGSSNMTSFETVRYNLAEMGGSSSDLTCKIYLYTGGNGLDGSIEIDYIRYFGFNNWTYTSGVTNNEVTAVSYYNSTEDAVVMTKTFDSSNDYFALTTRNQSIGYYCDDMVLLATVKASANSSVGYYPSVATSGADPYYEYAIFDDWQTIALPLGDVGSLLYFRLYFSDATYSTTGSYSLYIKNNLTLRPSYADPAIVWEENFAGSVSLTENSIEAGDSQTDTGDTMLLEFTRDVTDDGHSFYTNDPSIDLTDDTSYWIAMKFKVNTTQFYSMRLRIYEGDSLGGDQQIIYPASEVTSFASDTWYTIRVKIDESTGLTRIECVSFYVWLKDQYPTYQDDLAWEIDYVTIGYTDDLIGEVYGESFASTDDWIEYGTEDTHDVISTDGDHAQFDAEYSGSGTDYDYFYENLDRALPEGKYYVYVRGRFDYLAANGAYMRIYTSSGLSGSILHTETLSLGKNSITVYQYSFTATSSFESISLYGYTDNAGEYFNLTLDYIRIAPYDGIGYQYDGSAVHFDSTTNPIRAYSDGDALEVNGDSYGFGRYLTIDFTDSGESTSGIKLSDYPFFEIKISNVVDSTSDGDVWDFRITSEPAGYFDPKITDGGYYNAEEGVFRYNLKENDHLGTYAEYIHFYLDNGDSGDSYDIDYFKFFAFDNWTLNDVSGTDDKGEVACYYDASEDALVMEMRDMSTGGDYIDLRTRNGSIGYSVSDMVLLVSIKAASNSTARFRTYCAETGTDLDETYYLYDQYQTIAIPFPSDAATLSSIRLFARDWSTATDGSATVYIKNNLTIRPSFSDPYLLYSANMSSASWSSSWTLESTESVTTTNGMLEFYAYGDSSNDYDQTYNTDPSRIDATGEYLNIRYKVDSTDIDFIWIILDNDDDPATTPYRNFYEEIYPADTDWHVLHYKIEDMGTGNNPIPDKIECLRFAIRLDTTESVTLTIDYATIGGKNALPDTYGESFAVLDAEWAFEGGFAGTATTDGDVVTITETTDTYARYSYTFASPQDFDGLYMEVRVTASSVAQYRINLYGGTNWFYLQAYSNDVGTFKKLIIDENGDSGFDASAITKITFAVLGDGGILEVDYIRIAPADAMGYQDDFDSISWAIRYGAPIQTTNDDILSIVDTDSAVSGIKWNSMDSDLSCYSFVEIKYKAPAGHDVRLQFWDEDSNFLSILLTEDGTWQTDRYNLNAGLVGDEIDQVELIDELDNDQEFYVDYIKFYSISNWTVTGSASNDYDDVMYVDSNDHLVFSEIVGYTEYFSIDYDPTMSVSTDYNCVNLTVTGIDDLAYLYFRTYDTAWNSWITDDTRDFTQADSTITDMMFTLYDGITISEIEFYTDTEAPEFLQIWANPSTPDDENPVTITVYANDSTAIDLYAVTLDAISYPTGYSDTARSCSKNTENTDVWNYTFSTLTAGYYVFQITLDDGIHTTIDIITLQVTVVELQVTDVVLITATTQTAQISGYSNKDSSYTIYENDSSVGSGSVSEGWFSISWTKDSTAGAYIRLGILFSWSTYSEWVNGSYSVASATVLQITDSSTSSTSGEMHVSGYSNLVCSYYVYSNDSYQSVSGSLTAGSFDIVWSKLSTIGLHRWALKFNDSATTRWINGSYEVSSTTFIVSDPVVTGDTQVIHVGAYLNLAAQWYLYDNDTYQSYSGSASEGSFEALWSRSSTIGLHNWALKFNTTSGSTRWINGSYYVSSTTFVVTIYLSTSTEQDVKVSGYINLAADYTVTSNGATTTSGSLSAGSFEISWSKSETLGLHEWRIEFNSSGTIRNVTGSYYVSDDAFQYTSLSFVPDELSVTVTITSTWQNGTIYATDEGGNLLFSGSEGAHTFSKMTGEGNHPYTVYYDAGAYSETFNLEYSYEIDPSGGFDAGDLANVNETLGDSIGTRLNETRDEIIDEILFAYRTDPLLILSLMVVAILLVIIVAQRFEIKKIKREFYATQGWFNSFINK